MATIAIGNSVSNTAPLRCVHHPMAFGYLAFGIGAIDTLKPGTCAKSNFVSGSYAIVPRALKKERPRG